MDRSELKALVDLLETEDNAIAAFLEMAETYGWAFLIATREDANSELQYIHPGEGPLTDEEWKLVESGNLWDLSNDMFNEYRVEMILDAVRDAVSGTRPHLEI